MIIRQGGGRAVILKQVTN